MIRKVLYYTTAMVMLTSGNALATPALQLKPSAAVSGLAGDVVGWGFSLTNDVDFLVPTFVNFCEGAYSSSPCPTTLGKFTDYLSQFQFVVVGPGATLTEAFFRPTHQGIGDFTINAGAAAGAAEIGTIFLVYDRYSCDFLNNPACTKPTQTTFSARLGIPARVDVTPGAGVPEPGTLAIVGMALLVMTAGTRRR